MEFWYILLKNSGFYFVYSIATLALILAILIIKQGVSCYFAHQTFSKLKITGPKPTLFIGNYAQVRASDTLPHLVMGEWLRKYGNYFGFYIGPNPILVIKDVDVVKEIMIRKFDQFSNRPPLIIPAKPIVDSLLSTTGVRWKTARSKITPAFSTMKLKLMTGLMNKNVDQFIEVLAELSKTGNPVDIFEKSQALTLKVISGSVLAMDVDCIKNDKDDFLKVVREFFEFAMNPAINFAIFFPLLAKLMALINNHLTAGRMTDTIVSNLTKLIRFRRQNTGERSLDMLQLLLDSQADSGDGKTTKATLNDIDIIANCHIFLLAGYETTSNTLAYTFYLLALHQDIQDRLYDEIKCKLEGKSQPTYEDIKNLTYLEQVLNESLRMYPPLVFFIERVCEQECVIKDFKIPKGVTVHIPVWQIHRDPVLWPEPDQFKPERFAPEKKKTIHAGAFLPFGIGPHVCIGQKFAMLEAQLAIAKVLLRFRVVPTEEMEVPLQLTCATVIINPKNGIKVKLIPRSC